MQSPRMSFLEATANTVVTFVSSWLFQMLLIRPFVGEHYTGWVAFWATLLSTVAGFVRAYALRRWFDRRERYGLGKWENENEIKLKCKKCGPPPTDITGLPNGYVWKCPLCDGRWVLELLDLPVGGFQWGREMYFDAGKVEATWTVQKLREGKEQ